MKFVEIVNLAGSIVSITGISIVSLVSLNKTLHPLNVAVIIMTSIVATLFSIGLVTLVIELLKIGATKLSPIISRAQKIIYWTFSIGFAILLVSIFLAVLWSFTVELWSVQFS